MEEDIKEKQEKEKAKSAIKPGGQGITITPVSSTSSKPTTPLPRVSPPSFPDSPLSKPVQKEKKDMAMPLLLLVIIFNAISLWIIISIGSDSVPDFLAKFF